MPKLPESATFEAAFSFGLAWSAALRLMDVASTVLKRMASFTAFTFLPPIFVAITRLPKGPRTPSEPLDADTQWTNF
jgi:hypothetical protein